MNTTATTAEEQWSQPQEGVDGMAHIAAEDFDDLSNMFGLGNYDLDAMSNLDTAQYGSIHPHSHMGTHPSTPFDEAMSSSLLPGTSAQDFGTQENFGISNAIEGQSHLFDTQPSATNMPFATEPIYHTSIPSQMQDNQHGHFTFQPQQTFPPSQQVPPTPNSFELHGDTGRFLQQQMDAQQRAMLEHQFHMRKQEQIQFTPMASPAGTPHYGVPSEYTVPGAYFSPLTSPALHAQGATQTQRLAQAHGHYTTPSTASNSNAPSPVNLHGDVEMVDGISLPGPAAPATKRTTRKKKIATPRSAGMTQQVKQSPIQKPLKRKSISLSTSILPREMENMLLEAQQSGQIKPTSAGLHIPQAFDSSENESISPEPLSEALMGPPPRPGSATQSPAITAQRERSIASTGTAATPRSLLAVRSNLQSNNASPSQNAQAGGQASLDDLQLPEAASGEPSRSSNPSRITRDIQPSPSDDQTPRLAARKTPKLGPLSTPSSARPLSATASPTTTFSPVTASTPAALLKDKKVDVKGRGLKKRGSVSTISSAVVSPALRPKISPSIKPLLPEGSTLHSPTHALLLASKSNYQNLLEGNHLPGVNYPDSLSTGLTSKRTSHKVAEQGRRNRINEALKEMQALVPVTKGMGSDENGGADGEEDSPDAMVAGATDADSKEAKEAAAAKSNSSKAATVESANRYIRQLRESDASQKAAILALKKENDEMRRRLEEAIAAAASASASGKTSPASAEATTSEDKMDSVLPKLEEAQDTETIEMRASTESTSDGSLAMETS